MSGKYQQALTNVVNEINHQHGNDWSLSHTSKNDIQFLQKLVDKETGVKPVFEKDQTEGSEAFKYDCGCCGRFLGMNYKPTEIIYCDECGTKIIWEDKEV